MEKIICYSRSRLGARSQPKCMSSQTSVLCLGPGALDPTSASNRWEKAEQVMKCRQIHLPHATFSHVQSLHRSHSMNARVHWLKMIGHSSTRHVSPFGARDTEHHQHKFSHLLPLCYCLPLLRFQTCCSRIHLSTVKIHGGVALLRNTILPRVMSPRGSSSTGIK